MKLHLLDENPTSVTLRSPDDPVYQYNHLGGLVLHRGPPPSIGWWQATNQTAYEVWRHWDGSGWTSSALRWLPGSRWTELPDARKLAGSAADARRATSGGATSSRLGSSHEPAVVELRV